MSARAVDRRARGAPGGRPTRPQPACGTRSAGPLSIVLMPLLAALAAFGLARSGQVLLRAAVGMALGFAYFVVDNLSLALGNVGAYPPCWRPGRRSSCSC